MTTGIKDPRRGHQANYLRAVEEYLGVHVKVMHVGQEVRATHGLTSSNPSGWIVGRGAHGVVTKVIEADPVLYVAEFRVFDRVAQLVTVNGISGRDVMPTVPARRMPAGSLFKAS